MAADTANRILAATTPMIPKTCRIIVMPPSCSGEPHTNQPESCTTAGLGMVRGIASRPRPVDVYRLANAHSLAARQTFAEIMHKPGSGWAHGVMHKSPRSEERRVGKECRSRWSPYD